MKTTNSLHSRPSRYGAGRPPRRHGAACGPSLGWTAPTYRPSRRSWPRSRARSAPRCRSSDGAIVADPFVPTEQLVVLLQVTPPRFASPTGDREPPERSAALGRPPCGARCAARPGLLPQPVRAPPRRHRPGRRPGLFPPGLAACLVIRPPSGPVTARPRPPLKVAGALAVVYLVWGSTYLAIRVMVEDVSLSPGAWMPGFSSPALLLYALGRRQTTWPEGVAP